MILSYIKRNQLRRLFYPVMLLCVVIFLVWRSPVTDYLTMKTLDHGALISDSIANRTLYAKVKTQTLYYSGQDCWAGGALEGHYYYELVDGICHFYLIRAAAGYPAKESLEGQTVIGRIDSFDSEVLDELTENLAEGVDWDRYALEEISQKYYVNQTVYLNKREILLMVVLVAAFLIAIEELIRTIVYICNPRLTPAYRNLGRYGNPRQILYDVERQMKKRVLLQTRTLILTPGYLVEISDDVGAIIPLEAVLWIYDHAAMHYGLKGKRLSYTIHMVTVKGDEYTMKGKSHKEVDAIYHELTTRYPNYFYGYSREHEEMVRYIIKEMKKEKNKKI